MNTCFVSPLAYDLLEQYGSKKIIDSTSSYLRMSFSKKLLLNLESKDSSGLEGYLETKKVEFVQFMILQKAFWQSSIPIEFSMAYFDNDIYNGIDGFITHNNSRIAIDLTHMRHMSSKIGRQSRIHDDHKRIGHIQGKRGAMPHNYGRVVVGFSSKLYNLSRTIIDSADCIETVSDQVQEIQNFPGLNGTHLVGLNKKGENWINKLKI